MASPESKDFKEEFVATFEPRKYPSEASCLRAIGRIRKSVRNVVDVVRRGGFRHPIRNTLFTEDADETYKALIAAGHPLAGKKGLYDPIGIRKVPVPDGKTLREAYPRSAGWECTDINK